MEGEGENKRKFIKTAMLKKFWQSFQGICCIILDPGGGGGGTYVFL